MMDIDDIHIGEEYKVDAHGTSNRERYHVTEKKLNKYGEWDISARKVLGKNQRGIRLDTKERFFRPENFVEKRKQKKTSKQIEYILGNKIDAPWLKDGVELYEVEITFWPNHKRRGRKPSEK